MTEFGGFGCRFLFDDNSQCGRRQRPGSSYCPVHHRLCHLPLWGRAERAKLREATKYLRFLERRQDNAEKAPPDQP
jgi:hypothetical protein